MYTGQLLFLRLSQSTDSIMFLSFWQTEEEECERGKQQGTKVEAVEETAVVASVSLFTVYNFVQLLTPLLARQQLAPLAFGVHVLPGERQPRLANVG